MSNIVELDRFLSTNTKLDNLTTILKEYIDEYRLNLKHLSNTKNSLQTYTNFTEKIIKFIYKVVCLQSKFNSKNLISIIAQGSLARKEICPYSDIDIMFCYKNSNIRNVEEFIQNYLYFAWDCGLDLKHRVHEIDDIIQSSKDISIKSSMLESRFICGSKNVWIDVQDKIKKLKKVDNEKFIETKMEDLQRRKREYAFSMEINLKQASGGLRDYHTLLWICKVVKDIENLRELSLNYLNKKEYMEFKKSIIFINKARFFLHVESGKKQDVLNLESIPEVAKYFNMKQISFLKEVFKSIWCIKLYSNALIEIIKNENIDSKNPIFYEKNGIIYANIYKKIENLDNLLIYLINLKDKKYFFNITLVYSIKRYKKDLTLTENSPRLLSRLFHKNYINQFLYLFYKSTLFSTIFPPLKHILYLPQFDGYHTYPVGIHTLKTLHAFENIEDNFVESLYDDLCEDGKYLLKIVLLFHDCGKGRGGNHSYKGAKLFKSFSKKINLNPKLQTIGYRLILNHNLMSRVANMEDIYSEKTIFSFLANIKDEQTLRLLYILTYCDIKGVGDKYFRYFNSRLLRELYDISLKYFDKNKLIDEAQRRERKIGFLLKNSTFIALDKKEQKKILSINSNLFFIKFNIDKILEICTLALKTMRLNFIIENNDHLSIEIIRKKDINITHILRKLSYLNILEMDIFDLFDDLKYFKIYFQNSVEKSDIYLIEKLIKEALYLPLVAPDITPLIKQGDFKLDCEHSKTYALMKMNTKDQKGLLAYIMYIFDKYGIKITSAKIQTIKKRTRNLFLIEKQGILCQNKGEIMNLLYTYTKTKGKK